MTEDTKAVDTTNETSKPPIRVATVILLVLKDDGMLVPINDVGNVTINGQTLLADRIATPHEGYRLCADAAEQYSSMRTAAQIIQTSAQITQRSRDDLVAILGGPSGVDRLRSLEKQREDTRSKKQGA